MIITAEMLRKAGVREDEVTQLTSLYGEHVDVTDAWALEHAHDRVDWGWAAVNLLSEPARRAYGEAIAPAQRAYGEATESAWRVYKEAIAPAQRAYGEATEPDVRAFKEAIAPARRAYREAMAVAFARALNIRGSQP